MIQSLTKWFSSYHQKTPAEPEQVEVYEGKARAQEAKILAFFVAAPGEYYACHEVEYNHVLPPGTPHSSYIRAISNLCRDGKLVKGTVITGNYGRPVNTYAWSGEQ